MCASLRGLQYSAKHDCRMQDGADGAGQRVDGTLQGGKDDFVRQKRTATRKAEEVKENGYSEGRNAPTTFLFGAAKRYFRTPKANILTVDGLQQAELPVRPLALAVEQRERKLQSLRLAMPAWVGELTRLGGD